MTWTARTTRTPGLWMLRRDGIEVGTISLLPGTVRRAQLAIDAMVNALNHPPRPDGFAGKAGDMLAARRAHATMLDNTKPDEP
jgi:hypothetical protein